MMSIEDMDAPIHEYLDFPQHRGHFRVFYYHSADSFFHTFIFFIPGSYIGRRETAAG